MGRIGQRNMLRQSGRSLPTAVLPAIFRVRAQSSEHGVNVHPCCLIVNTGLRRILGGFQKREGSGWFGLHHRHSELAEASLSASPSASLNEDDASAALREIPGQAGKDDWGGDTSHLEVAAWCARRWCGTWSRS